MIAVALIRIATMAVSVALAVGLVARDHGLRANRSIAAFLLCNAGWALGEILLLTVDDPNVVATIYRGMALGWMPLGVFAAHATFSLSSMEQHPILRQLPLYGVAIAGLGVLSLSTDWVVAGAEQGGTGWRPIFGPGIAVAYLLLILPVVAVLRAWRTMLRLADSSGQLLLARIVFFGISGALAAGTFTSLVLPAFRIDSVRITTTLVAMVGLAVAWTLRRFGHSLIAPQSLSREILDTLEDGVVLVGPEGRLRDANRAFLRMVGETETGAIGRPIRDWLPDLDDPDGLVGTTAPTMRRLEPRAGGAIPVVVSAPVPCTRGRRVVGHAILVRDRREIAALQRQLVVSARLAAVGDLSQPISKAIKEPVARVRDELDGLALDWATGRDALELAGVEADCSEAIGEGHELIEECVEGADRITSIVREVAGFTGEGRREAFAPHALDLIVERAVRIARVHAPKDLEIEMRLDPEVRILCHFAEVERVVTNLLVNAIHAHAASPPGARHVVVAVAAQDGRALLHVEDDGCGIDPEFLDRIFDPFFTTKPVGKGTGLGLAIAYHIVQAHGGEIHVSSEPGRGTSVAVSLPRAPLAADAGSSGGAPPAADAGSSGGAPPAADAGSSGGAPTAADAGSSGGAPLSADAETPGKALD